MKANINNHIIDLSLVYGIYINSNDDSHGNLIILYCLNGNKIEFLFRDIYPAAYRGEKPYIEYLAKFKIFYDNIVELWSQSKFIDLPKVEIPE